MKLLSREALLLVSLTPMSVTRQTMYCTYNATLMHVLATIVAVEKQCALHIVCVCV